MTILIQILEDQNFEFRFHEEGKGSLPTESRPPTVSDELPVPAFWETSLSFEQ